MKNRNDFLTTFIAIGPHYWGKGETIKEAIRNCIKASGNSLKKSDLSVCLAHERTTIDKINGGLVYQPDGKTDPVDGWYVEIKM